MNHLPTRFRDPEAAERPLTRRAQAKLETRDRVLQAAKRLFIDRGFEGATIRDIASEAGMSTGAVFANFTDKHDLFHAVLNGDLDAHLRMIEGVINHPGPVSDALLELFSIGYDVHLDQLPLLQAATSLSWTSGLEGDFGERPQCRKVIAFTAEIIEGGVKRGELKSSADSRLVAEMIWDAYIANYRRALFGDWGADQLKSRLADQIAVILDGLRP